MKNVLLISAKANMISQFNLRNIEILQSLGFKVHVGSNFLDFGSMSGEENEKLKAWLDEKGVVRHQLDFERELGTLKSNMQVFKQIRNVLKNGEEWEFIHAHSPIGAAIGRVAAKSLRVKTLYTAHGFHFFKGASLKKWAVFPVEWLLGFITDGLVTINHEDYAISRWIPAKRRFYLPSIGIDVKKLMSIDPELRKSFRNNVRKTLGIPNDAFVILNVGELSVRKNQEVVIRAMAQMDASVHFIIAGVGPRRQEYQDLAAKLGVADRVHLLGYRTDKEALHAASDVFVFPSKREGFGIGGFEAMVDGLYIIGSKNTGMVDYVVSPDLGVLVDPTSEQEILSELEKVKNNGLNADVEKHRDFLLQFDNNNVDQIMREIYLTMSEK